MAKASSIQKNNLRLKMIEKFSNKRKFLKSNSFDGNGNYSFGIKEHIIFPEINFDKVDKVKGLDVTICTSAKNNNEALALLKSFNMPFIDKQVN